MATKQEILDAKEALRHKLGAENAEALFKLAEDLKNRKASGNEIEMALKAKAVEMCERELTAKILPFVILPG